MSPPHGLFGCLLFTIPSLVASLQIDPPTVDKAECADFQECCAKPGTSAPKAKITAFVRTWDGDLEWLPYCLQSLCTFGTAVVTDVRLVVPEKQNERFNQFFNDYAHFHWVLRNISDTAKFFGTYQHLHVPTSDYVGQLYDKMNADTFGETNDYIMYIDTDAIFHREFLFSDVFVDDHLLHYPVTPFESMPADYQQIWAPGTAFVLDLAESDPALSFDFMRRMGLTYPRTMFKQMRETISNIHEGKALSDIIFGYAQTVECPSEFEIMGAYAYKYLAHAQMFDFENDQEKAAGFPVLQFRSWGGLQDHVCVLDCVLEGKGKDACAEGNGLCPATASTRHSGQPDQALSISKQQFRQ
jgi:hypothetical protein